MRKISNDISERLARNIQTKDNNANPSAVVWVTRPRTSLISEDFIEKQTVLKSSIEDVSIAACHPYKNLSDSRIYIAYVSGGIGKVVYADTKTNILAHYWKDLGYNINAKAISIAFDGRMVSSIGDKVEVVTEENPWLFWVDQHKLFAKKLNVSTVYELSETGCTDVSAIRATWSDTEKFNFGLIAFFILNNKIYYRQLINGVWMDAEEVNFGPSDVLWSKVSAFRTMDYRVGIQVQTTTGDVYELFTQFMGIGKHNTEHIDIADIKAESNLTFVAENKYEQNPEHVELKNIVSDAPYGGLYSTITPQILSVRNINDDGDWSRYVEVKFNTIINEQSVSSNISRFTVEDSTGKQVIARDVKIDRTTGTTLTLDFTSLTGVSTTCKLKYTQGTLMSMASIAVPNLEYSFDLQHIDDSEEYSAPVPTDIWNIDSDGTKVAIQFSYPLTGELPGNEDKFTVTINEYNYYPDGELLTSNKAVTSLTNDYCSYSENIDLSRGTFTDTKFSSTGIKLEVDE